MIVWAVLLHETVFACFINGNYFPMFAALSLAREVVPGGACCVFRALSAMQMTTKISMTLRKGTYTS